MFKLMAHHYLLVLKESDAESADVVMVVSGCLDSNKICLQWFS